MKKIGLTFLLPLGICVSGASWAGIESCNALLQVGIYNIKNTSNDTDSESLSKSTFCQKEYDLSKLSSSEQAAISGSYGMFSAGASGAASETQIREKQREVCKSGFVSSAYTSNVSDDSKTIYQGALDAWNTCQKLNRDGGVNFDLQPIPSMHSATVTISANSGVTAQFQGLIQTGTGRSTCQTTFPSRTGSFSAPMITVDASTSFPFSASNKLTITCSRNMVKDGQGNLSADAQGLIFNTSAGPLQIELARTGSLSRMSANEVISQARDAAKVDTQAAITAASDSILKTVSGVQSSVSGIQSSVSALQKGPVCVKVSAQSSTVSCSTASVTATVPQGYVMTGGGCSSSIHTRPVRDSYPNGSNGWYCATQDIVSCQNGYATAYVIGCKSQ